MLAMLAKLCGGAIAAYPQKLVRVRLELVAECVKESWADHGAPIAMPDFGVIDIMTQLCMWKRGGCGTAVERPSLAIVSQMSRHRASARGAAA